MKFNITQVDMNGDEIETISVDVDITEEELHKEEDIWCTCDYLNTHPNKSPQYKPEGVRHLGVTKHGYVCPCCGKFVQIG